MQGQAAGDPAGCAATRRRAGAACQRDVSQHKPPQQHQERTSLYWYWRFQRNRCCCTSSSCARWTQIQTEGQSQAAGKEEASPQVESYVEESGSGTRASPPHCTAPVCHKKSTQKVTGRTCTTVE